MQALDPKDASALSLLAESPSPKTKKLVINGLSDEAKKIADRMVSESTRKTKSKRALKKTRTSVVDRANNAVEATANALLRWSK